MNYELAIYLVVRKDLKMSPGKIVAQCGHAVESLVLECFQKDKKLLQEYHESGRAKISLKIDKNQDFLALMDKCKADSSLNWTVVTDSGRTQIEPGSQTCIGIGPVPKSKVEHLVGDLKLL